MRDGGARSGTQASRRRWIALGSSLLLAGGGLVLPGGDGVPASARTRAAPRGTAPATPPTHGTPKGWRFAWPKGDPAKGRAVFEKLECYSCHEVRGERFPAPSDAARAGPELSGMGALHPPEFFAEAIINPGAVIERGHDYAAADGSSKMPSYGDVLTIQETIDLVAFLHQLRPPPGPARGKGGHSTH